MLLKECLDLLHDFVLYPLFVLCSFNLTFFKILHHFIIVLCFGQLEMNDICPAGVEEHDEDNMNNIDQNENDNKTWIKMIYMKLCMILMNFTFPIKIMNHLYQKNNMKYHLKLKIQRIISHMKTMRGQLIAK